MNYTEALAQTAAKAAKDQMSRVRQDVAEVRSRICDVFLVVLVIVALPALAASLYRTTTTGWLPIMTVQIALFAALLFITLFRKRVPYNLRAGFIISGFLILGIGGTWQLGLLGTAVVFLVVAPAISAILFGGSVGVAVLVIVILALGITGAFVFSGYWAPLLDPSVYLTLPSAWLSAILGSVLVAATLLAALIVYNKGLFSALKAADLAERTLTQRIEERTADLTAAQEALIRQERLAALGQLTGTVAHEIRNPLGALASSLHVIKRRCSDEGIDLQAALDRADRSIGRCDRIINELLDYSRAKGIRAEPTALDSWLSDVVSEQNIPPEISVNINLQTDGATVPFDPDELRRAVINLIDNACQAMAAEIGRNGATGAGELTVTSRISGQRAEIEFADTGPGVPEDILPHVLEPLFSTKSFGTGLGLSIVQRIMAEHGGGLEIDSEEGRGTRIVLWLPLSRNSEKQEREDHIQALD